MAIRAEASSQPLLNLGLLHSLKGAWGVNGTSNNIWFGLGVLLGVGITEGPACPPEPRGGWELVDVVGLGVEVGLGVALGSDSKPGNELVRVKGVLIDRKAMNEIKIPAPRAVVNKIRYSGIFLMVLSLNIS